MRMDRKPRAPSYDGPFTLVHGCVVQRIPQWDAVNLRPHRWEVIAPEDHCIAGYGTTMIRRETRREAIDIARYHIEYCPPF